MRIHHALALLAFCIGETSGRELPIKIDGLDRTTSSLRHKLLLVR